MYFTHLECASRCGAGPFDPRERFPLPVVSASTAGTLRLERGACVAARSVGRTRANMWRYRELMPLLHGDEPVTLGEASRRSFTLGD